MLTLQATPELLEEKPESPPVVWDLKGKIRSVRLHVDAAETGGEIDALKSQLSQMEDGATLGRLQLKIDLRELQLVATVAGEAMAEMFGRIEQLEANLRRVEGMARRAEIHAEFVANAENERRKANG